MPRGREGVCGELGNFGGGRAKIFFSGPKCPPSLSQVLAVLTVLAILESIFILPSFCLSYNEATVVVLTVLAVSAVMAVSVMTATPLKLNPPIP